MIIRLKDGISFILLWIVALSGFLNYSEAASHPVPRIEHCDYQLRRLRVGTVHIEHAASQTLQWDAFDFLSVNVEFNRPVFVNGSQDASLEGALLLECPKSLTSSKSHGVHMYPLENDSRPDFWRTNETHVDTTEYFEPKVYVQSSPSNPYRGLLAVFNVFDQDESVIASDPNEGLLHASHGSSHGMDRSLIDAHSASTRLQLLVPIARRRLQGHTASYSHNTKVTSAQEHFDAAILDSCSIRYVPASQRTHSKFIPIALSSQRGVEVSQRPVAIIPAVPTRAVERTVLRLSSTASSRAAAWAHTEAKLRAGELVGAGRPRLEGDAYGADVAVLLEAQTQVRGIVGLMFDPVIGGFVKPVIDLTHGMLMDSIGGHFQKKIATTTVGELGSDLIQTLGVALRANISNILTDSLTYSIGKSLSDGFIAALTPVVQTKLKKFVPQSVGNMLDKVLLLNIPAYVNEHMPRVVARGLSVTLLQGLTRSISHALVPTLTHALPHSANADYYCHVCATQNDACHLCHFSALSVYYQVYYGTYYTDYFSDYYGNYYTHALRRVDEATHQKIKVPGHTLLDQTTTYLERAKIQVAE